LRCFYNKMQFNQPVPAVMPDATVAECPDSYFCATVKYDGPPTSHPKNGTFIAGCFANDDPQFARHGTGCSAFRSMLSESAFTGTEVWSCCLQDLCNPLPGVVAWSHPTVGQPTPDAAIWAYHRTPDPFGSPLACANLGFTATYSGDPGETLRTASPSVLSWTKAGGVYSWAPCATGTCAGAELVQTVGCSNGTSTVALTSAGVPNHDIGLFPLDGTDAPTAVSAQTHSWSLPAIPTLKEEHELQAVTADPSVLPQGAIGWALNGVPFHNPFTAGGDDTLLSGGAAQLAHDLCGGRTNSSGAYHYHVALSGKGCLFHDQPNQHSPKIGYALDGIPIYGPLSDKGRLPTDLDACNGRVHPTRGYIYHVTAQPPYIIGCFRYKAS